MTGDIVRARGHSNVTALHPSTFEITRDREISIAADCIIAVGADKGAADLSEAFRAAAADDNTMITATISCGGFTETVSGWGCSKLSFAEKNSMVFRVSNFVCDRTVMIGADKPAARLNRGLASALAAGKEATIELRTEKSVRPEPSFDLLFGSEHGRERT